jgi:hypothetical protein
VVRVLIPIVLRALAVTLLLATVLLPAADHHAVARLAGALVPGEDAHWLLVHHHPHRAATDAPRPAEAAISVFDVDPGALAAPAPTAPAAVLEAAGAPTDALVLGVPLADLVPLVLVLGLLFWRLADLRSRRPHAPTRAVPLPPPRVLLAAAA